MPDMPDKADKKKALDLMIVLGGKPKKDEEYEGKEYGKHKGCKCPCCGMPCKKCKEGHDEDSYEDSYEDYEDEDDEEDKGSRY